MKFSIPTSIVNSSKIHCSCVHNLIIRISMTCQMYFEFYFNRKQLYFTVKSLSDLVNESLSLSEMDAVAASSRLSTAAISHVKVGMDSGSVPTLSSLASEAIGNELPAARVLRRLQPPTGKLIAITKHMNHHLTSLLVSYVMLENLNFPPF